MTRQGLSAIIDGVDDMEVVGVAGTVEEALNRIPACRPDVALLDVRLPDGSGIEVCREIRSIMPEVACLILSAYSGDDAIFSAVMAGAAGYILKDVRVDGLIEDIRKASAGESLLDPKLTQRVLDRIREGPRMDERLTRLTPHERALLDLIGEGMTNREIAAKIHLAETTTKNYVSKILSKLDMPNRAAAAAYVARIHEHDGEGESGPTL
ncbi:MAG: response regulator transcription factor [Actinobacteria bacterium]|nr:response regulator transcription factor [Actinomycetota bacterium]MCL5444917.1 response regulator transcription factor [Actinomycetota bacterium]